jgi:hypothetical protein
LADALANITSTGGDRDMFLRAFWEAQMHAYEHAAGWVSRGTMILDDVDRKKLTSPRVLNDSDLLELQD